MVLDAFYKMFPPDIEENSNSDMARMYAMLDKYAEMLRSVILVVHHASKSPQADKGELLKL